MHLLLALPLSIALAFPGPGQDAPAGDTTSAVTRAQTLLLQGKSGEALAILQPLAATRPAVHGVQHALGIAYYRTGKLIEAQKAFTAAIQEDAADLESVQMLGLTLYRLGHMSEAIPYLERVHQWMPNSNADSNYVLGLCYMNARRYDDARKAFAADYAVAPESGAAYLLLGTMLMRANLPEIAAGQASKALEIAPGLPLAHFMLGEIFLFKSDVEHARVEFETERRINPAYAATYDRLGDVYSRSGKLEEAQASLTKAIALDRSSTGPFILMGKVLLRRNDPQTATLYLKHAEKMDAGNFITHTLLAQAYRRLGMEEDAKRETDLASKIHSEDQLKLQPVE